ncbi:SNF2 family N-terminal domain-domain-containing protein [Clohesyomyces aquaticus]|uniref:SNF2 family N-terminal domain-domain-containing protein n=1 Tax=Clohesyomyces aquaticus TaxID=1231657 RepID=A0A1Y2A4Z0_9PLEO|nr:SNF2 family N-terminal domain-domain-containing protein [Clohesyomyces aquaticus]
MVRRSSRAAPSDIASSSAASPAQEHSTSQPSLALTNLITASLDPPAASRKPSRNPRANLKRTRSSRTFVQDSSDIEDDSTEAQPLEKFPATVRRVLKEVAIVTMPPKKKAAASRPNLPVLNGVQMDQDSSAGSPSLENSDYETPGTSISTTPAMSTRGGNRSNRKGKAPVSTLSAAKSRKRSRLAIPDSDDEVDEDVMDTSSDAQLARQLQEEEYADAGNKRQKTTIALESDDDLDIDDLEIPPLTTTYKGKGKGKAMVLPSRSARSSAKKAMTKFSGDDDEIIADSEDDFQLSEEDLDLSEVDDIVDLVSDSDDAPLINSIPKRPAKPMPRKGKKPAKSSSKNLSYAQKKAKKLKNEERASKFAHIEDKWERKRAMNRERAEESHPKLLTMWDDLEAIPVLEVEKAEQPKSINRRLKPFQLEGLSWMMRQEKTDYRGGLLGDEMGMGKTIQAVSLIMSDYPAKQPTLVVVPPVALMQWSNEIREYTDGKLKVLVYHGTNAACKKMSVKDLKKFDVIMVSYNSLESLHRKETKGWSRGENIIKEASPLHAITYHRLILDEAHSIKSRNTGVAKACFALKGDYKWCLSGTPVQNRIGEFFSLLRFLEVRPFADYFCRSCECEQLHWTVDEDHMCTSCEHGGSEHISVFNQELLNPITGDDPEDRENALQRLHMITARIMLRRMKRDHTNSMELPMKDIIIHNEFFSAVERDFSSSIMSNSSRKFDTYVAQGVMLNNYANIFGLIMQMRQVANHPDLLLKKNAEGGQNVLVCNICDEPAEDAVRSRCHHEFCRACVKDFMDTCEASGSDADCPRCHIGLSIDFEQPEIEQDEDQVKKTSIINRIKMDNWTSSTKIEMLIYDLYKLRSKKQTLKSIVFSQFTSMLQLIEWRLRRAGFNTVMLDGSMTPAQRQKSIEYFMTNPDVEVFLVSLKAGGVALNLTEASRVFIVDPWWNPAAEWQSADRCHRIGQRRPCVITRLCIEDSVESRMVALQEKKAAMIAGTVNNDKVAMDRLSPEDLQFLFRGT